MARTSAFVISLATLGAICAAAVLTMKFTGLGWRAVSNSLLRVIRQEHDHPNWEVLMQ